MTELLLLRHADAGDPLAWDGPDEQRPLSDKGRKQADRLGRFLAAMGIRPDVILTSPKVRAAQTAEIVGQHLSMTSTIDDHLGDALGLGELELILRAAGDPVRPMIVGHDPDFTDLVTVLCDTTRVPMRKGALARIDVGRSLEPGDGTLRWLLPPDVLKPDH